MKLRLLCSLPLLLIGLAGCKESKDARPGADSAPSPTGFVASQPVGRADEPVTLKVHWPPGARLAHRMELVQNMDIPMPGAARKPKQEVNMAQDFSLNVLGERPGGGREVELEFQAIIMSVTWNGNEVMAFDSRGEATGDESNPAVRSFRLLAGQKFRCHLDASNAVEKVEGVKEFAEKVAGPNAGGRNPATDMFNEEYFKQMMNWARDLPAGPVKPGDTWKSSRDLSMGPVGQAALDLTYTFKGWEQHDKRRCALLEFDGPVTGKAAGTNSPFGVTMSVVGGRASGKSWFDPARSFIIDTTFNLAVKIQFQLPPQPGAPDAASPSESAMDQRISVKLVEESAK